MLLAESLRRARWLAVPLLAYVVITLVLPAANGAAARPDFARHAAIVLGACVAAITLCVALNTLTALVRRRL